MDASICGNIVISNVQTVIAPANLSLLVYDWRFHYNGLMKPRKTLQKILAGSKNIAFPDMAKLVEAFGFELVRVRGSHHIFSHPAVLELINLQNVNGRAKPYQIRQFLKLIERNDLELNN